MVVSTSRLAYSDCFDLMEKAIADEKGIQIKFARYEDAHHFRLRLHASRKIDRNDNKVLYGEDHPMYGRSVYDQLTMRIRKLGDDSAWLRLERIDAREFEIESLSENPLQPELAFDQPISVKVEPAKSVSAKWRRM
jgi:hypothetical protein